MSRSSSWCGGSPFTRPARRRLLLASSLLLIFALPGWAQPPARDPAYRAEEAPKTATIRGRITALDTGRPLRRVVVRASGEKMRRGRAAMTDADGRYELKNLAPGRYSLWVQKGGYVALSYGQRGPRDPGRPVEVASGQTLDKIDVRLPRGSVITGRVVDELGEPVANVNVSTLQYRVMGGKRQLVQTGGSGMTNDIGQYRVFGLPPGGYYVSATNQEDRFNDGEDDPDPLGYAMTFYPGTNDPAEAQPVTVTIGEEAVADIQLTPMRLHSVSGVAVDAAGKPITTGFLTVFRRGSSFSGDRHGGSILDTDGMFTVHGLSPGTYVLQANGMGDRRTGPGMRGDEEIEVARATVTVAGEDVTGLRLAATKGGTLRGRAVFEGGPPPTEPSRRFISCHPVDTEMGIGAGMHMTGSTWTGAVKGDETFELKNVFGPCIISGYAEGWMLKAVRIGGTDVTEQPIEAPPQKPITDVEIVFTNQLTTVMGSVTGSDGTTVKDYSVVAFPEDRAIWSQSQRLSTRVRTARSDQSGLFKIRSLRPGDYLVVALENFEEGSEQDPEILERLRPLATPARLAEGGTAALTLKLSTLPP